jgi:hypothetical protein
MTVPDEDDIPESDPYCAHWISVYDAEHIADNVLCENCGESCHEHTPAFGAWCPNAPEGTMDRERHAFKNAAWPAEHSSPLAVLLESRDPAPENPGADPMMASDGSVFDRHGLPLPKKSGPF